MKDADERPLFAWLAGDVPREKTLGQADAALQYACLMIEKAGGDQMMVAEPSHQLGHGQAFVCGPCPGVPRSEQHLLLSIEQLEQH